MGTWKYNKVTKQGNKTVTESKTVKLETETGIAIQAFKKAVATETKLAVLEAELNQWASHIPSKDMEAYLAITGEMAYKEEVKRHAKLK